MKRKLLPVFLSFALLANGSMTAFAADPIVDSATENGVATAVSEDQGNQEEQDQQESEIIPDEESKEKTDSVDSEDSEKKDDIEVQTPEENDAEEAVDVQDAAVDLETEYKNHTFGADVTGAQTVNAIGSNTVVILDVRSEENYTKEHLYGSISTPVFANNGASGVVVTTSDDELAKTFTKYVTDHKKDLTGKDLYLLCNSGQRGARAAAVLLSLAGYDDTKIHTITGGASDKNADTIQRAMKDATEYKFVAGSIAVAAASEKSAYIIDVRSSAAQKKTGTLSGETVVSQSLFDDNNNLNSTDASKLEEAFLNEIPTKVPKDKPVYIICNSGKTGAQKATKLLTKLGYNTSIGDDGLVYTITNGAKGIDLLYAMSAPYGEVVDSKAALAGVGNANVAIIDVRANGNYGEGHLKGSISLPLFFNGKVIQTIDDDLAKAFTEYITTNKDALSKKEIYVLCNSGASGARAATALLSSNGYDHTKIHTIKGGYNNNADIQAAASYVSDTHTINVLSDTQQYLILDVRSTENYTKGHLKGSLSLPLFDKDNNLPDDLAKAFTDYVNAHKADFANKTIYVLCNSGSRGAEKATKLLKEAGITKVFTIENGAKSQVIQSHFVTDTKTPAAATTKTTNTTTKTAATTKTGDTAPIVALSITMLAALSAIIAISKKKFVK